MSSSYSKARLLAELIGKPDNVKSLVFEDYCEDEVELVSIETHRKGQGTGSKVMRMIVDAADEHGINLMLIPAGKRKPSERLIEFYEGFGFEVDTDGEVMRREHQMPDVEKSCETIPSSRPSRTFGF